MSADPERWRKAERRDRWSVLLRGLTALGVAVAVGFGVNGYLNSNSTQGQLLSLTQKDHSLTQSVQKLGQGNQRLLDQLRTTTGELAIALAARNADEAAVAAAVDQVESALAALERAGNVPPTQFSPLPAPTTTPAPVKGAPSTTSPRVRRRRR